MVRSFLVRASIDSLIRLPAFVTSAEEIDVESALRLAMVKFGHRLELSGSDDFLMLFAAEVAGRAGFAGRTRTAMDQ